MPHNPAEISTLKTLGGSVPLAILALGLPAVVYWQTMPPGLTWANFSGDGGDLMTAACHLGVPHPPGYPVYVLLGRLVCAIPSGEVAWRFHVFSALSVLGAAAFLFSAVLRLTRVPIAALSAAWALTFAPLVWSQAIITEVYALNLLAVCAVLWLITRRPTPRGWFSLGLAWGLALSTHLTSAFLAPLLILPGLWVWRREAKSRWLLGPLGLLIGLSAFLYLPLHAPSAPIVWGEPKTAAGFWWLVSGAAYRDNLFATPPGLWVSRALIVLGVLTQVGPLTLTLGVVGLYRAWQQNAFAVAMALLSATGFIGYALAYNTADSYVYLLPIFALLALSVGLGVAFLWRQIAVRWQWVIVLLAIVGPLIALGTQFSIISLRGDTEAERFWQMVVETAPQRAVILTQRDEHTFALWYAQHVLVQRADIAVVDTRLSHFAWHRRDLRRNYPWLEDISNLETIFERQTPHRWPLCQPKEKEQATQQVILWELNCLNKTEN